MRGWYYESTSAQFFGFFYSTNGEGLDDDNLNRHGPFETLELARVSAVDYYSTDIASADNAKELKQAEACMVKVMKPFFKADV